MNDIVMPSAAHQFASAACGNSAFDHTLLVVFSAFWFSPANASLIDGLFSPFFVHRSYVADIRCQQCAAQPSPTGAPYFMIDSRTAAFGEPREMSVGWASHRALMQVVKEEPSFSGGYLYLSDDTEVHFDSLLRVFDSASFFLFEARAGRPTYPSSYWCGENGVLRHSYSRYARESACFRAGLAAQESHVAYLRENGLSADALCQSPQNDVFFLPARHRDTWLELTELVEACKMPFTTAFAAVPLALDSLKSMTTISNSSYEEATRATQRASAVFTHPFKYAAGGARYQSAVDLYVRSLQATCSPSAARAIRRRVVRSKGRA